jgi:signal transduction histidine kinase/ActR/RegA family two-component response regulator
VFRAIRLRTKFLLSILAISAGLTAATLAVVSHHVERGIRNSLRDELQSSVKTYQTFAKQREDAMLRSAAQIANLPNVRALMTTEDVATIQDESNEIWRLSGSDLLVLGNRKGEVVGLQAKSDGFSREQASAFLVLSMQRGATSDWWLTGGHLYEVWLQPIYFGSAGRDSVIGALAVGVELDDQVAKDFSKIVASEIVFASRNKVLASSLPTAEGKKSLGSQSIEDQSIPQELQVGDERYLVTSVSLSSGEELPVTMTVLRSLDKATAFLARLNYILLGLGFVSVLAGGTLVFLVSHTFTKPLSNLVAGVRALDEGNFDFPLQTDGVDEVGEVTGAFDRMRTNLKKTQAEQRQLEGQLRQAHKMEAVGRLAGGVAHDFNNLLTVIRGNSDLLMDRGGADAQQKKYLEQIQKASDRAVSMTRQLLAFSRMQVLQPRVMDLNTTISEMSKMIPRLIGEHIEYSFLPDPALAPVLADPGQMEQVFLNLAVNARDAMEAGGKLSARTANVVLSAADAAKHTPMAPGEYVQLSVTDTGHGMDPETKAHIFEPFFTTKGAGKGTGLGLATVYGIVKQSGGFIWVESAPGLGATFDLYLPACRKPLAAGQETREGTAIPGGKETILLVEDETGVRELASELLRSGGYTVLEARDGTEAVKCATNHSATIDLLLTDMVMPRMSGSELAEKLWSNKPDLRVIFMTGYAEFPARGAENISTEAAMLQKPFSRLTLLEKVREVLSTANRKQPDRSKVSGPA